MSTGAGTSGPRSGMGITNPCASRPSFRIGPGAACISTPCSLTASTTKRSALIASRLISSCGLGREAKSRSSAGLGKNRHVSSARLNAWMHCAGLAGISTAT